MNKMVTNKTTIKTRKAKVLELAKETPASVIAVQRQYELAADFLEPKVIDEKYMNVPEVFRALNLRAAAIIYRGYEIQENDDSEEAKMFAADCYHILEKSGGVNFIEQWHKNAEAYGNGYVELVEDGGRIVELALIHSHNFGYELEEFNDPVDMKTKTRVKLDPNTKKPVGYASYKYDENKEAYVNEEIYPLEKIVHLKFNTIGDALYGVSILQPMASSIEAKLKMEASIEAAGKMVAAPKMVIKGDFPSDEVARQQAREAASLDVNDVIILNNGEEFQFVNPGQISLPELREIFVVNITTASGVPRPLLTSESAEINKATMDSLISQLRENMRSNMNKMANILKNQIFYKIGEKNGIANPAELLPDFIFPEDPETERQIIEREEKKAATLTSLSNNLQILNNIMSNIATGSGTDQSSLSDKMILLMESTIDTYQRTLDNFTLNNDQSPHLQEKNPQEYIAEKKIDLDYFSGEFVNYSTDVQVEQTREDLMDTEILFSEDSVEVDDTVPQYSLNDEVDRLNDSGYIENRHNDLHHIYEAVANGVEIYDIETGSIITIPGIVAKHKFYIKKLLEIGSFHEPAMIGEDLDYIY